MWVKGDDFHESVSPKAIQWAGTAGTKGVDQHGAAPALLLGRYRSQAPQSAVSIQH